jgi:hypothetical protein
MLLRYPSRLVLPFFRIALDDPVYIVAFHGTAPSGDHAMDTCVRRRHAERLKNPKSLTPIDVGFSREKYTINPHPGIKWADKFFG